MPKKLVVLLLPPETRKLIDDGLGSEPPARAKAETALLRGGPLTAAAVRLRLVGEKDAAIRKNLEDLSARILADSPELADSILLHAKRLNTCGSNYGPFCESFSDHRFIVERNQAKLVHFFFVAQETYAPQMADEDGEFTTQYSCSYIDDEAAVDLYALASAMYSRLAAVETDGQKRDAYGKKVEECAALVRARVPID